MVMLPPKREALGRDTIVGKDGKGVLFRTDEAEVGSLKAVFPKGGAGRVEWSLPNSTLKYP